MNDVTVLMYVVLAASVLALGFAYYFYRSMLRKDEGTGSKGGRPGGSDPGEKGTLADEIRSAIFGAAK